MRHGWSRRPLKVESSYARACVSFPGRNEILSLSLSLSLRAHHHRHHHHHHGLLLLHRFVSLSTSLFISLFFFFFFFVVCGWCRARPRVLFFHFLALLFISGPFDSLTWFLSCVSSSSSSSSSSSFFLFFFPQLRLVTDDSFNWDNWNVSSHRTKGLREEEEEEEKEEE